MPDEPSDRIESLFEATAFGDVHVPSLFWYELRNVLLIVERRKRVEAGRIMDGLRRMRLLRMQTVDMSLRDDLAVTAAATTHNLTAYDATYLVLARNRTLPLATTDRALAVAACDEGVELALPQS